MTITTLTSLSHVQNILLTYQYFTKEKQLVCLE